MSHHPVLVTWGERQQSACLGSIPEHWAGYMRGLNLSGLVTDPAGEKDYAESHACCFIVRQMSFTLNCTRLCPHEPNHSIKKMGKYSSWQCENSTTKNQFLFLWVKHRWSIWAVFSTILPHAINQSQHSFRVILTDMKYPILKTTL